MVNATGEFSPGGNILMGKFRTPVTVVMGIARATVTLGRSPARNAVLSSIVVFFISSLNICSVNMNPFLGS